MHQPQLKFGARYRINRPGVFFSQDNPKRTNLEEKKSHEDLPIPVGTVITLGDWIEWNPYSESLKKASRNPGFYYVTLDGHPEPTNGIVQAHVLEKSVEEV